MTDPAHDLSILAPPIPRHIAADLGENPALAVVPVDLELPDGSVLRFGTTEADGENGEPVPVLSITVHSPIVPPVSIVLDVPSLFGVLAACESAADAMGAYADAEEPQQDEAP